MSTIEVSNGYVQGRLTTVESIEVTEFLNIPYCKAPINDLRFERPKEAENQDGIINYPTFQTSPPQVIHRIFDGKNEDEETWIPTEPQDENCLYANVWVPGSDVSTNHKYPVLIWIYGGGFVAGSSSLEVYNGGVLAAKENIIVVSFNYRIGLLGFLCLDFENISGNQGIWDQLCALKWIYNNIHRFGGDNGNITLAGNSAGGCSVSLFLLIEESWNYFNKVILSSGVCFSDWGFLNKDEIIRRSKLAVNHVLDKHQQSLKWNDETTEAQKVEILSFLKTLKFEDFLIDDNIVDDVLQFPWTPCVDGDLIKDEPRRLFTNGQFKKCPSIFLNVENEGTYFILSYFPDIEIDKKNRIEAEYLDDCFIYFPHFPHECSEEKIDKIKKMYNLIENDLTVKNLDQIISDRHFVCDSIELANVVSKFNKNIYYLWFNIETAHELWPEWTGVMHSDDLYLLFGSALKSSEADDKEKEMAKSYMKKMSVFIKDGCLPDGLPHYNEQNKEYVLISKDSWKSDKFSNDLCARVEFWKNIRNS